MSVTPLVAEEHSVDDQVEWLDDEHVMYYPSPALGANVWVLHAAGKAHPGC